MQLVTTSGSLGEELAGVVLRRDVEFHPFDTTASFPLFQVRLGGRRFVVNEATKRSLEFLATPRRLDELDTFVAGAGVGVPNGRELLKQLQESPLREALVDTSAESSAGVAPNQASPGSGQPQGRARYMLAQLPMVKQEQLRPISAFFSKLFDTKALWVTIPLILFSHAAFAALWFPGHARRGLPLRDWLLLSAMVYIALMFHEIGHASACHRFGSKHGDIGIGLYLIWPVFYTDVSDSWGLPRLQRAVIDVAGVYFHLLFSSLCIAAWMVSHSTLLALTVTSILIGTVINLNPFLRFDGYWLMTDLIGLANLRFAMSELRHYITHRLVGVPARRPMIFNTPRWVQLVFVVYCFGAAAFTAYIVWRVSRFIPSLVAMPANVRSSAQAGKPLWQIIRGLLSFLISILGISLLCRSLLMRAAVRGKSVWKTFSQAANSRSKAAEPGKGAAMAASEVAGDASVV